MYVYLFEGHFFSFAVARSGEATDFNLVKSQSRGHARKVKLQLPSVSARTKADRKRSDYAPVAKVETCSLRPRGQNDCNGKRL